MRGREERALSHYYKETAIFGLTIRRSRNPKKYGGQIFQDNVVAAAIIDRLVHHTRIFYINGSGYRLKNKPNKAN